jgi:hypothetical protein
MDNIYTLIFSDGKMFGFTKYQLTRIPYFNIFNEDGFDYMKMDYYCTYAKIINRSSIGFELLHAYATTGEIDIYVPNKLFLMCLIQCQYFKYYELASLLHKKQTNICSCRIYPELCSIRRDHICICESDPTKCNLAKFLGCHCRSDDVYINFVTHLEKTKMSFQSSSYTYSQGKIFEETKKLKDEIKKFKNRVALVSEKHAKKFNRDVRWLENVNISNIPSETGFIKLLNDLINLVKSFYK